ncbi:DUF6320 domain-containing protein [Alkalibacter mobilis]|uniref:DUF6320 domain-containing protein n=1 Tax=Alkalibacter mobilis TaxID=2787712 RepID=UPI0018A08877|nr:DUF6320 domain-containing protein [Alkalibacter mobilis]MBF7096036.1 hypothetical protein [Alkalibacter mobilis]
MAYCPKCGVKVDQGGKNCPLCDFPIPDIEGEDNNAEKPFPTPENVYPKEFKEIKKRILKNITVIFMLAILVMIIENIYLQGSLTWAKYSVASTVFLLGYITIFLNFIPNVYFYLVAAAINTTVLLFTLDMLEGDLAWFFSLGLPLVVGTLIISVISVFMYRRLRSKILLYIGVNMFLAAAYFAIVEAAVTRHLTQKLDLFWSYIGGIPLVTLGLALFYFHFYFPAVMKEEIKRRFHI